MPGSLPRRVRRALPLKARALGLLACASLALSCGGGSDVGGRRPLTERWPGGQIRVEGQEVESDGAWVKNGPFTFYDENGVVSARGQYALGLETGPWLEVYADGSTGAGSYEAGRRSGDWTLFHPTGEKQEEGRYEDGRREGVWTWYFPNGERRSVAPYVAGKKHGVVRFWGPDGSELSPETWEAGERTR